jgi:hypothetical protein
MVVFDIADTKGADLPAAVQQHIGSGFSVDGRCLLKPGSGSSTSAGAFRSRWSVLLPVDVAGRIETTSGGWRVSLNALQTRTQQFATLVHELGHLFCGHLGRVSPERGPDRDGPLTYQTRELEAEAVAWLVCQRFQMWPASASYLSGYLKAPVGLPPYSLEAILGAAGAVEQMIKGQNTRLAQGPTKTQTSQMSNHTPETLEEYEKRATADDLDRSAGQGMDSEKWADLHDEIKCPRPFVLCWKNAELVQTVRQFFAGPCENP